MKVSPLFLKASGWLTGLLASRDPFIAEVVMDTATPIEDQQEEVVVASDFVQSLPPLAMNSRRVVLLRHGETDWNSRGLIQGGGYDLDLNEAGKEQANRARQQLLGLPFGVVASSHLERSAQTADAIAPAFPSAVRVINHKFGEMRFGDFEGVQIRRSAKQNDDDDDDDDFDSEEKQRTRRKFDDFHSIIHENQHVPWPGAGGECIADVQTRGQVGIQQLLRSFPDCNHFCIVAHGRFNKLVLMALLGLSGKDVFQQGNACINVLDVDADGKWKAHVINHMDHISSETAKQAPS